MKPKVVKESLQNDNQRGSLTEKVHIIGSKYYTRLAIYLLIS